MATPLRPMQVVALASSVALLSAFVAYRVWSADRRTAVVIDANAGVGSPSTETFVGTDPALIAQGRSTPHPVTTKRGTMVEPKDVDDPAMFWGSKSGRILTPPPPSAEQPAATAPPATLMPSSKDMILIAPDDLLRTPPVPPVTPAPQRQMFSGSKSGSVFGPDAVRAAQAAPRLTFTNAMAGSKSVVIMTPDDPVFNPRTRLPARPPASRGDLTTEEDPFWMKSFWWWRPPDWVHDPMWDWAFDTLPNQQQPEQSPAEPAK